MAGGFEYKLPDFGYPEKDKLDPDAVGWGDVADFATDRRNLKAAWPGTAFADALKSTGNVARGEGGFGDALNIAGAFADLTPVGKLATLVPAIPALRHVRNAGKWGSYEAAEKAQKALDKGAPADEVWSEFGFTNKPYGVDTPLVTALDTRGTGYVSGVKSGRLGDKFHHPELYAFDPSLKDIPVALSVGPDMEGFRGSTMRAAADMPLPRDFRMIFGKNGYRFSDPSKGRPFVTGIKGGAGEDRYMSAGLHHEVGHAVSNKYGLPEGASVNSMVDNPYWGVDSIQSEADMIRSMYGDIGPDEFRPLYEKARRARYLMSPGEQTSRGIAGAFWAQKSPEDALSIDPFGKIAAEAHQYPDLELFRPRPLKPGDFNPSSEEIGAFMTRQPAFAEWKP